MRPVSWLKVFCTIQVKFSLLFTKLLIQSVYEHDLTTAYFLCGETGVEVRSNKSGYIFCGKNCFDPRVLNVHVQNQTDTSRVALNEPFPGGIIQSVIRLLPQCNNCKPRCA